MENLQVGEFKGEGGGFQYSIQCRHIARNQAKQTRQDISKEFTPGAGSTGFHLARLSVFCTSTGP